MKSAEKSSRVHDLVKLLHALREQYEQLSTVIIGKLDAVRHANWQDLQEFTQREKRVTDRLRERHGLRRQLMGLAAREAGLAGAAASTGSLTVPQLAERVPAALGAELNKVAATLREVVSQVAQANRVFAVSTRELITHLRWTFDAVRPQSEEPGGYELRGRRHVAAAPCLIDAVG